MFKLYIPHSDYAEGFKLTFNGEELPKSKISKITVDPIVPQGATTVQMEVMGELELEVLPENMTVVRRDLQAEAHLHALVKACEEHLAVLEGPIVHDELIREIGYVKSFLRRANGN